MASDDDESYRVPRSVMVAILGVALSSVASVSAWAVTSVNDRPTEAKVKDMVEVHSPYYQDRSMILQALMEIKAGNLETRRALERNTTAIAELQALIRSR